MAAFLHSGILDPSTLALLGLQSTTDIASLQAAVNMNLATNPYATSLTPLCYMPAVTSPHITVNSMNMPSLTMPMKRGPDDMNNLIHPHGSNCDMYQALTVEGNESKKVKLDLMMSNEVSKVMHIRNIPSSCNELDIVLLAVPFGKIKNLVYVRKNNQALMEMENMENVRDMVQYYAAYPPCLQSQIIIVEFSDHSPLDVSLPDATKTAENAIETGNQLIAGAGRVEPRSVLHVIVENSMSHNINHLVIYKIFQRFSKVLRTIMFTKNSVIQCLVQLENPQAAYVAKLNLNGQNIYNGCCTLRIEFSKNDVLEVRSENDKCRDFVRTPLTLVEKCALNTNWPLTQTLQLPGYESISPLTPLSQTINTSFFTDAFNSLNAYTAGTSLGVTPALSTASLTSALSGVQPIIFHPSMGSVLPKIVPGVNSILLVSNLNEQKVTPDHLFVLFGVYGDVQRVKIMYNKKDNALVQFSDVVQAHTAMENLKGVLLWDKPMKITFSRHSQIQMPKEETDIGLTKDYSGSHLHRFKKPNSKNYHNIYPPSTTLHLSNMPCSLTEETLKNIIHTKGYSIVNFKFLMKEKKMALVELSSVQEAVHALIDLHNWQLSENCHLRISFSKAVIP